MTEKSPERREKPTDDFALECLRLRAEVRALLVREREMDFHDALDEPQGAAQGDGIDIDAAQAVLAAAFGGPA